MPKAKDLTNRVLGLLKVVERTGSKNGSALWKCECKCGNVCYVNTRDLMSGDTNSCGCIKSPNLTDRRFERLKVSERTDKRDVNYNVIYKCQCDCGNITYVTATDLLKGNVKSCGCLAKETQTKAGENIGRMHVEKNIVDGTNLQAVIRGLQSNNTSGYRGVTWDKSKQKWKAQLVFRGKRYNLGRFDKKEDAVKARKLAEEKFFVPIIEKYNASKIERHDPL